MYQQAVFGECGVQLRQKVGTFRSPPGRGAKGRNARMLDRAKHQGLLPLRTWEMHCHLKYGSSPFKMQLQRIRQSGGYAET